MSGNDESVLDVLAAATNGNCGPLQMLRAHDLVAELIAAVEERVELSRQGRKSTGPFAESDARIDAALAACKGGA